MDKDVKITSIMDERRVFYPPEELRAHARIKSREEYERIYKRSIEDREGFWSEIASELFWFKKWDKVNEEDFPKAKIQWFIGGKTNISYNCLDVQINKGRGEKTALIWQGEPEEEVKKYTYSELLKEVSRFANVLKKKGVKKGDRVAIYMPMVAELPIALLACARIGAIHTVVFGGFSAEALHDRVLDSGAKMIITANGYWRSGRVVNSKANVDRACELCAQKGHKVENVIVLRRLSDFDVPMVEGRDTWWHEEISAPDIQDDCPAEVMDAEDPLFILYTSGTTGKPKGVLHTTGGYMVYVYVTMQYHFDLKENDIFWCTADIGWVTGHSYVVYGPLLNGVTTIVFEGVPTYPQPDRFWHIIEKFKVTVFYTAPTAIRACMREGDEWPNKHDLSSLRVLGSVGEPINPEAWIWYYKVIGKERCPISDCWWQTETGGHLIAPMPGAWPLKPGSATLPFFGVEPVVLRPRATPTSPPQEADINEGGELCIKRSWPGIMRGVYGDPNAFYERYFTQQPGFYYTGDGARKDEDGYFWLMGRIDDVVNVSGHRIGTAEVESALVSHPAVAEAAVVGYPHEIKGEDLYAFVILKQGYDPSDELRKELINHVRKEIGPIATPGKLQFVPGLPKTRSGKIMRRILRKIASGEIDQIGDTTTLAEPSVVEEIIKGRL
ncbi:MAG: acetate--CoA ligase [Desulfobacterota bacterium]|nr:acetate--CoA ligase [Thermodesulfobacteriota bacterium]MDW8001539.1 acetate--CoA ligase [Deltaproteobacteria bacterium]